MGPACGATIKQTLLAASIFAAALIACHSKTPNTEVDKLVGPVSLTLSPSNVSLPPGAVFPVEVILNRTASFADPVLIRVDALPSGVSASPLTIPGSTGVFYLSASPSAPVTDNAAVIVRGTGPNGTVSADATLRLSVGSPDGGFLLGVVPRTLRMGRGSTSSALVTVIRRNFSAAVTVTVSGLPDAGVTADRLIVPGTRGNLVFRAAPNATPGTSFLTLLGASGSTSAATPLELVVLDPGGLDETFGASGPNPGWVVTQLGSSDGGTTVNALAVAVQSDGKILVAGNRTRPGGGGQGCGPGGAQNCIALTLTRYNSDGTLDSTFGAPDSGVRDPPPPGVAILPEGASTPPLFSWPSPQAVVVTDGGILVASGGANTNPDSLLQFTSDGFLDPNFNPDGGNPGHAARTISAKRLTVMPDGGILVAGLAYTTPFSTAIALARYSGDGIWDRTFGDGGILSNRFDGGPTINVACGAIFSEDKARVAVITQQRVGVMSFDITGNGSIDESFNGTGQAVVQLGSNNVPPCAVLGLGGSTIVVAGASGPTDVVMGSFLPDGGLDPGFGEGGIARAHLPPNLGTPSAAGAAATLAGQIVVAGSVSPGGSQLLIARYMADGSPDLAFGPNGTGYITNVPNLLAQFNAVTVQADGKIVGTGNTPNAAGQQMVIRYLGSGTEE